MKAVSVRTVGYCDCEVFAELGGRGAGGTKTDFEKAESLVGQVVADAIREGWDMRSCLKAFETPNGAVVVHSHVRRHRNSDARLVETCLSYARTVLYYEDGTNED